MTQDQTSDCVVSIVMPTYNGEEHLSETIKTVQDQTFQNWELVIVDDGSSDQTLQLASDLAAKDGRISVQQLPQNSGGPARPRNVGVSLAKGEWIGFLDADDLWHPRKLELQLKALTDAGLAFSCTGLINFSDSAKIATFDPRSVPTQRINHLRQRIRTAIPNSSVMIKTDLVKQFPFNEDRDFRAVEDYHCWLRVLGSGETCLKLKAPLLDYRISDTQISAGKWSQVKKVFMVHQSLPIIPVIGFVFSALFTATHSAGAIVSRRLLGRM